MPALDSKAVQGENVINGDPFGGSSSGSSSDPRLGALLSSYGVVGDGVTNDAAALQAAINDVSVGFPNGPKSRIVFPYGKIFKINSGLTIDISKLAIDFNYSQIDASGMLGGAAINVTGSNPAPGPYGQEVGGIHNLHLIGNSLTGDPHVNNGTIGYNFNAVTNFAGTRAGFYNLYARGFFVGAQFQNRCYLNHFYDCEFAYNTTGIYQQEAEDAGESVSFYGGIIYNGHGYAIKSDNHLGHINLFGVSLDYNWGFVDISAGASIYLYGCNLETNSNGIDDQIKVDGDGSSFYMQGGKCLNTAAGPLPISSLVGCGATFQHSFVQFESVWQNGWKNNANRLARGNGRVINQNPRFWSGALATMPTVIGGGQGDINNKIVDGSFENGVVATPVTTPLLDNIFILEDGSTKGLSLTSAYAGTNVDIGIVSTPVRTGSRALRLSKKTAAGNNAKVIICVAASHRAAWGGEFYSRGDGTVTGTFTYGGSFCHFKPSAIGTWFGSAFAFQTSAAITPGTTYAQRIVPLDTIWYAGQTHWGIMFDLTALGIGSIYIEDVNISEW